MLPVRARLSFCLEETQFGFRLESNVLDINVFFSKPLRSASSLKSQSYSVSGILVLIYLLSGDVELNPGPSGKTLDSGPVTSYHRLSTKAECSGTLNSCSVNPLKKSAKEGKDCICSICEDQILEAK